VKLLAPVVPVEDCLYREELSRACGELGNEVPKEPLLVYEAPSS